MVMKKNKKVCCICGNSIIGWGNNPWPIKNNGECCNYCNGARVIPARIALLLLNKK